MKCKKCEIDLGEDFFLAPRPKKSGVVVDTCALCRRAQNAERNRRYRERNRDAINARLAEKRSKHGRGMA